jgi:hypothetical protein
MAIQMSDFEFIMLIDEIDAALSKFFYRQHTKAIEISDSEFIICW